MDGYNPADFGATNISQRPSALEPGGAHYTAWGPQSGQISWDVDPRGQYVPGSLHMTDRNISDPGPQGPGSFNTWRG